MREKQTLTVDVAIVGGGIIGTAVARELSKYDVSILLVEGGGGGLREPPRPTSGIVHAGFHEEPGTLKAKYCFPGNQMYPKLCEELDVCFRRNGILMVARNQEEWDIVQKYYQRGKIEAFQWSCCLRKKLWP